MVSGERGDTVVTANGVRPCCAVQGGFISSGRAPLAVSAFAMALRSSSRREHGNASHFPVPLDTDSNVEVKEKMDSREAPGR